MISSVGSKADEFEHEMCRKLGCGMGRVDIGIDFHNIKPDNRKIFQAPDDSECLPARNAAGNLRIRAGRIGRIDHIDIKADKNLFVPDSFTDAPYGIFDRRLNDILNSQYQEAQIFRIVIDIPKTCADLR